MTHDQIIDIAVQEGFSSASVIDTSVIVFDASFRSYCMENLCGQYGANHSCPPLCGTPEEMKQRILKYKTPSSCKRFGIYRIAEQCVGRIRKEES